MLSENKRKNEATYRTLLNANSVSLFITKILLSLPGWYVTHSHCIKGTCKYPFLSVLAWCRLLKVVEELEGQSLPSFAWKRAHRSFGTDSFLSSISLSCVSLAKSPYEPYMIYFTHLCYLKKLFDIFQRLLNYYYYIFYCTRTSFLSLVTSKKN